MKLILALLLTAGLAYGENLPPKVNTFKTMHPSAGTNPVATSSSDTLNFTSSNNTVTITGNSGTKTLDFASVATGVAWGSISGTLSNQTDLQNALNAKQNSLTPGSISTSTSGVTIGSGASSTVGPNVTVNIQTASNTQSGLLSSADWATFNGKQGALTLGNLTTPTSGVSVSGGTGAIIGSGAAISIQTATGSQPGLLSATDWTSFNGKQASGNYITALTGEVTASGPGSVAATLSTTAVTGKAPTGFSAGAGTVSASDTILTAFNKIWGWILNLEVDEINGQIETVSNKSYFIIPNAAYARTINNVYLSCSTSGAVTVALAIGGTPVTGCSAISVTSTPSTTTCTAANSITANSIVSLTASSNSACLDLIFTVKTTR